MTARRTSKDRILENPIIKKLLLKYSFEDIVHMFFRYEPDEWMCVYDGFEKRNRLCHGVIYFRNRTPEMFTDSGCGGASGNAARWNAHYGERPTAVINAWGYALVSFLNVKFQYTHIIWILSGNGFPQNEIHHKDKNKLNNNITNLSDEDRGKHMKYHAVDKKKGDYPGLLELKDGTFTVSSSLGVFDTKEEAIAARDRSYEIADRILASRTCHNDVHRRSLLPDRPFVRNLRQRYSEQEILQLLYEYRPLAFKVFWSFKLKRWCTQKGLLFHRERKPDMFETSTSDPKIACDVWNKHFAGQEAFTTISDDGYAKGSVLKRGCSAHQVIYVMLHGYLPNEIDHINRNALHNSPTNLRPATRSMQCSNRSIFKNSSTGETNIYETHRNGDVTKYMAKYRIGGIKTRELAIEISEAIRIDAGYPAQKPQGENHD